MGSMQTKKLIGAAAFSLALAGGGVAGAILGTPGSSGAQESTTTTTADAPPPPPPGEPGPGMHRRGPGLEAAAKAIGITTDELRTELESGKTIAQVAEAHDVSVDTVIDAMVTEATANIRERITALVNGEMPPPGEHEGPAGFGRRARIDFAKVADALGMTNDELRTALQGGQSLAQVAEAHGKTAQDVIDVLVANGVPEDKATEIVNHTGPFRHHDRDHEDATTTTTAPPA
jgi:hypothetical protein